MYMSDCTFAMSDCISQMLETHFGKKFKIEYNNRPDLPENPFVNIVDVVEEQ